VGAVPDGYQVDPDDLTVHRNHVNRSLDQVREALSAAERVSMSTEAYGKICQFFPPRLDPAENTGMEALRAAVEGLSHVATSLDGSARAYQRQEQGHTATFGAGLRP
jgi:hypothetical protein